MAHLNKSLALLGGYLDKHPPKYTIKELPETSIKTIVVIPAYREGKRLFKVLDSLKNNQNPANNVEIIVVFNASEADIDAIKKEQKTGLKQLQEYKKKGLPNWLKIHGLEAFDLREKHFGAGLARKTGLDEAIRRFHYLKNPNGVLVCLDADSPVAPNYFRAIELWAENPENKGAIIRFEHPLEGDEEVKAAYEGIILYELHLRYYLMGLRGTGFPYAFHTIGSCMVFRALNYVQAGGMPKKQAGEDFYFLQKLIPLGGFTNINTTTVYPSPRPSNRVVFGTGASITKHLEGSEKLSESYNPQVFEDLKLFFKKVIELFSLDLSKFEEWTYELTGPLRSFLLNSDIKNELQIIRENCKNETTFLKRFYATFNAFRIIKYINYAHEHFYGRTDLFDAAALELEKTGVDVSDVFDEYELLLVYRKTEQNI